MGCGRKPEVVEHPFFVAQLASSLSGSPPKELFTTTLDMALYSVLQFNKYTPDVLFNPSPRKGMYQDIRRYIASVNAILCKIHISLFTSQV